MTLQQLRDLQAVVSHGGYRAAARALDVSQAGLTKSVARLEEEYGILLLQRTAKGVVLSAEGEEFVQHARAVLQEADRAEEWLRQRKRPAAAQVKLGLSVEPSLRLAPAVMRDFRAACPDATVHVTQRSNTELLEAIRDNRIELAVMRLPQATAVSDLRVDVLYETAAAIVARKGHPLRHARTVRDLAQSEWIVVGDPGRPGVQDDSIRELFIQQQLGRPRFAAVSDSLFGAVSMLLESDCVARLPRTVLQHPLAAGALTEIRVREQVDRAYEVALVVKASRRLGREAAQLASMLKSFARLANALEQPSAGRK